MNGFIDKSRFVSLACERFVNVCERSAEGKNTKPPALCFSSSQPPPSLYRHYPHNWKTLPFSRVVPGRQGRFVKRCERVVKRCERFVKRCERFVNVLQRQNTKPLALCFFSSQPPCGYPHYSPHNRDALPFSRVVLEQQGRFVKRRDRFVNVLPRQNTRPLG